MHFESGQLYHIYNQGNNRQKIFFTRENYLFFLKKVKTCFNPNADILAWCLMPNHFHFMVRVNRMEVAIANSHQMIQSHLMTGKLRSLNSSIAIMLRSYTRAIHKQENITGALFRQKTKAECLTQPDGITPSYLNT